MFKRHALALALAALLAPDALLAQNAPNRTRIVFGYPPGDASDAMIRLVAENMARVLNRPFIVENMGGASGRIGTKAVINSPGDGSTLLYTPMAPVTLFPASIQNLEYDPFKDLKPISQIATFDIGLAAGAHVPVKTLAELVAWAKANPGKASYGVPGAGGLPNFFATMFAEAAGIKIEKIPYRGTAPALTDMIAGHLPLNLSPTAQMTEMHKTGKLRIIATSGSARSPFTPDVPTFRESGFNIEGEGWYALYGPATLPDAIVEEYSKVVREILAGEDIRKRILSWTFVPTGTTPQRMREIQFADFKRWEPIIKAAGYQQ